VGVSPYKEKASLVRIQRCPTLGKLSFFGLPARRRNLSSPVRGIRCPVASGTVGGVRLLIHFLDGEHLEADSDSVNQQRLTFLVRPTSGNNRLAWVSLAAVKYITFPDAPIDRAPSGHVGPGRDKVVLRFVDGDVVRAYKDEAFSQEGLCFNVRLVDPRTGSLQRALVSTYAIKAIFFVEHWDSRSPEEKGPKSGLAHRLQAPTSAGDRL
jgi:hypothetical protein